MMNPLPPDGHYSHKEKTMKVLFLFTSVTVLVLFGVMMMCASADASGHINAIYSRNPMDSQMGLSGDYEKDFGLWEIEADAQVQRGDIVESEAHVAIAFGNGPVQFKPFAELNAVYTKDWGHSLDGGAKINLPLGNIDVAAGMFLRNSAAFKPIETATRVQGTEEWIPDNSGSPLNFEDLGLLNALIEFEYKWERVSLGVTSIFDISNQTFHQVILDAGTGWNVTPKLRLSVDLQYIVQAGENSGQQTTVTTGLGSVFKIRHERRQKRFSCLISHNNAQAKHIGRNMMLQERRNGEGDSRNSSSRSRFERVYPQRTNTFAATVRGTGTSAQRCK